MDYVKWIVFKDTFIINSLKFWVKNKLGKMCLLKGNESNFFFVDKVLKYFYYQKMVIDSSLFKSTYRNINIIFSLINILWKPGVKVFDLLVSYQNFMHVNLIIYVKNYSQQVLLVL